MTNRFIRGRIAHVFPSIVVDIFYCKFLPTLLLLCAFLRVHGGETFYPRYRGLGNEHVDTPAGSDFGASISDSSTGIGDLKVNVDCSDHSTAKISWNASNVKPASLQNFIVYYGNASKMVSPKENSTELDNLDSFTTYGVSVRACTPRCPPPSRGVNVTTNVGQPSRVEIKCKPPTSHVTCTWPTPTSPAGPNPIYEFVMSKSIGFNYTRVDIQTLHSYKASIRIPSPDCSDKSVIYKFKVRPVNNQSITLSPLCTDQPDYRYEGEWSSTWPLDCGGIIKPGLSFWDYLLIVLWLLLIVFVIFLAYLRYKKKKKEQQRKSTRKQQRMRKF